MFVALKRPCSACPFRRNSAPGWLGADTPQGFMDMIVQEVHLPCHSPIDYEDKNWREQAESGPFCAGALIFMRNTGKLPRDPELVAARVQVEADHDHVFSNPPQFIEHHGAGGWKKKQA